jgi:hypothetical protein
MDSWLPTSNTYISTIPPSSVFWIPLTNFPPRLEKETSPGLQMGFSIRLKNRGCVVLSSAYNAIEAATIEESLLV